MKRFKALIITGVIAGIILVFASGFWMGSDFSDRFNFSLQKAGQILLLNKNSETVTTAGSDESILSIKALEQTIDSVSKEALTPKTKQELVTAAINGILSSLGDSHSEYFTKEQYSKIMESYQGIMTGGIGVVVTLNDEEKVEVVKIIKDSPSSKFDIKQGDIIIKVNGENISGLPLEETVSKIKGPVDTKVTVTFYRPADNKSFDFEITRGTFAVPNFSDELIEGKIAYIQYFDFQEGGAKELEKEIDRLIAKGAAGIILDLRNNLGGVLNDAVYLCDLFLDSGTIVTVKGRNDGKDSFEEFKAKNGKYVNIPLVVLINEYSASASELTAGALKDSKRATLIGEKSYGKGTVQVLHILPDGSGIKFTTAKYFLPSGESIDGTGIIPDILVKLDANSKSDVQKEKAIEEIKKLIK
ncbi:MAG: S41 family peptidase [Candidatus Humimicrobiaceae bacterium]